MTGAGVDLAVYEAPADLARAAAELLADAAARAAAARGRAALCLAGGSTPRATYRLLGAEPLAARVPWERVHLFWGDERMVPADHPDSNRGAALAALGPPPRLPAANLHPMPTGLPPEPAAAAYEETLRRFFAAEGEPRFDLTLLGLGPDGHTASLFPGAPPAEAGRWAAAAPPPAHLTPQVARITLTLTAINASRRAVFLVAGRDKAAAVRRVIHRGAAAGTDHPAALVAPAGGVLWLLDREAAALLAV